MHETSFFRISGHFTVLETLVLPEFFQHPQTQKNSADIRIWSAGCSTGEEAYSIAISFLEAFARCGLRASEPRRIKILATAISPTIIAKAQDGMYAPAKVQKIPQPLLDKYFEYRHHQYYITEPVKRLVQFQVFNLINIEAPPAPEFDLISEATEKFGGVESGNAIFYKKRGVQT